MHRILVIEDIKSQRDLLVSLLRRKTYESSGVGTLSAGRRACSELKPDLVLLDVHLPDGNGFDLCRGLRSDPRTAHIPVILMSGEALSADERVRGLESGADDYIVKPFGFPELLSRISRTLRNSLRLPQE